MAIEPFYTVGESGIDGREPVFWPVGMVLYPYQAAVDQVMPCECDGGDFAVDRMASHSIPPRVTLRPEKWAGENGGIVYVWRGSCPDCGRRYMQANGPLHLAFLAELLLSVQAVLADGFPRIQWGAAQPLMGKALVLEIPGSLRVGGGGDELKAVYPLLILSKEQWLDGAAVHSRQVRELAWRNMWAAVTKISASVTKQVGRLLLES